MKKFLLSTALALGTLCFSSHVAMADGFDRIASLDELTTGDYLVLDESASFAMGGLDGTFFSSIAVAATGDNIESAGDALVWTITKDANGKFTICNDGKYVSSNGSANKAKLVDSEDACSHYTVTVEDAVFKFADNLQTDRLLQYNSSFPRFAHYKGTQKDITLFKKSTSGSSAVTVEKPVITPETGDYTEAQTVVITAAEGCKIYYTLDESAPTTASTLYNASFTVSETTTVRAIAVDGNGNESKPATSIISILPSYTSIAAIKAAATTGKVDVIFKFTELLVAGKNGQSLYVTDGTDGLLLYTTSTYSKGDKISGQVVATLTIYNGLTELTSVDYSGVTVSTSGNSVTPQTVTIKNLVDSFDAYESEYITLENVFFQDTILTSKNVTVYDDDDNTVVIRDNFNLLAEEKFDTMKPYCVTAFVACFGSTIQLYPISADDIKMVTNLAEPVSSWAHESVVCKSDWTVANAFITNSDGVVTYTSSDESVATVNALGAVTVLATGRVEITASTAETSTYLADSKSFDLMIFCGDGSMEHPYNAVDAYYISVDMAAKETAWVSGTILGYMDSNSKLVETNGVDSASVASNLVIGNKVNGVVTSYMAVQLSANSDIRAALNLHDNPTVVGSEIWIEGTVQKYFGIGGIKSVTDFSWDGVIRTSIKTIKVEENAAPAKIYNILGQPMKDMTTPGLYIVNGKKILVK